MIITTQIFQNIKSFVKEYLEEISRGLRGDFLTFTTIKGKTTDHLILSHLMVRS